jgi:hypothetical protein
MSVIMTRIKRVRVGVGIFDFFEPLDGVIVAMAENLGLVWLSWGYTIYWSIIDVVATLECTFMASDAIQVSLGVFGPNLLRGYYV